MKRKLGVFTVAILVGACTRSHQEPLGNSATPQRWILDEIQSVFTQPWPEGPLPVAAGHVDGFGGALPLSEVAAFIPNPLPAPIPQSCRSGAIVDVTFTDGRTIRYGPCKIPSSIERLRQEMVRLALAR